jgi:hypothetical protein
MTSRPTTSSPKLTARQFARLHRNRRAPLGDFCRGLLSDPDIFNMDVRFFSWVQPKTYLLCLPARREDVEAAREFWEAWQGRQAVDPFAQGDAATQDLLAMGLTPSAGNHRMTDPDPLDLHPYINREIYP